MTDPDPDPAATDLDPAVTAVRRAVRAALAEVGASSPAEPEEPLVLIALSGGADSLALAAAAAAEGPRVGVRVGAAVVDHGLQPRSRDIADDAAAVATRLGLAPVLVESVSVGSAGGPEAAARDARYAVLRRMAEASEAASVFLGHTKDDQAETVLLGLARGAGAGSLRGMRSVDGLWRRPLLAITAGQTRAACAAFGLDVWDDPHNDDQRYLRVRLRHRVMPELVAALGEGAVDGLARTAQRLQSDDDALTTWAAEVLTRCVTDDDGIDVRPLADAPTAVRTRALRRWVVTAGVPAGALTSGHIATLEAFIIGWKGQGVASLPGQVSAWRSCGRLYLARNRGPSNDQSGIG
jgi:tRNA(Ile)-lysidine synthase